MAEPGATRKETFVSDLTEDSTITSSFLVHRKDLRQKQNGEAYLSLTLGDRSGQVEANMWERVGEVQDTFSADDFVKVRGQAIRYRDKLQLRVMQLRRMEEAEVDLADYLPHTSGNVEAMYAELLGLIATIGNPELKSLLGAIFGDASIAARFKRAPAAKVLHHAFLGGLLEHVCSLCRLAELVMKNYPFINADLLYSGVLLHDLGKIEELTYERSFAYSTEGQLLGHMIIALEIVHEKLRSLPDFPHPLKVALEHMIISHHGHYEFGSPKLPMFAEAQLLHHLDDLDSKMQTMQNQLGAEQSPEAPEWAGYNRSLERPLLRLDKWLASSSKSRKAGESH